MSRRLSVMVLGLRGVPNVQGGIETHAECLYPLLAELGCDIEIVTRTPYAGPRRAWGAIALHPLWAPRSRYLETFVHTFLGVCRALRTRPDVLHVHGIGPGLWTPLARLGGLRVVLTHHGQDYRREKWGPLARAVLRLGERLGVRNSRSVITVNDALRRDLESRYGVRARCIHNGITPPAGDTDPDALERFGLEPGRYVLGVGRVVPEKRHQDLVRAFMRADPPRGWKLIIAGARDYPGSYEADIRTLAAEDERIILAGFQPHAVLDALYAGAGLFVLPSSHEGHPLALLEAISFDAPVLATAIQGNLEIGLPDRCLFEPGDVSQLTLRLQDAFRDPAPFRVRGRDELLARYRWPRIARETLDVYRQSINA